MQALHKAGFPTPTPVDVNRHAILMSYLNAFTLVKVNKLENPEKVYHQCMDMIVRFAEHGLIHSDFNEFNLMITKDQEIRVIDFPQMVSTAHLEGEFYFQRDITCINVLFKRRFNFVCDRAHTLSSIEQTQNLDREVKASGFFKETLKKKDLQVLDGYIDGNREHAEEEQGLWDGEWDDEEREEEQEEGDSQEEEAELQEEVPGIQQAQIVQEVTETQQVKVLPEVTETQQVKIVQEEINETHPENTPTTIVEREYVAPDVEKKAEEEDYDKMQEDGVVGDDTLSSNEGDENKTVKQNEYIKRALKSKFKAKKSRLGNRNRPKVKAQLARAQF